MKRRKKERIGMSKKAKKKQSDIRSIKLPKKAWDDAVKLAESYNPPTTRPNLLTSILLTGIDRVARGQKERGSVNSQ